jgi:hypothetical protein
MAEQQLDLFKLTASGPAEFRADAAQVVVRDSGNTGCRDALRHKRGNGERMSNIASATGCPQTTDIWSRTQPSRLLSP